MHESLRPPEHPRPVHHTAPDHHARRAVPHGATVRTIRRSAVLAVLAVLVLLSPWSGGVASAHGDEATASLVTATPSADNTSITVTVKLVYKGDGDPVPKATNSVTGDNGNGVTIPATTLTASQPGEFTGTIPIPSVGSWNFRFTSTDPASDLAFSQDIGLTPSVTEAPTSTIKGSDQAIGATGSTTSTSADDGTSPIVWVLGAVVVLAVAIAGVVLVRRRSSTSDDADATAGGGSA